KPKANGKPVFWTEFESVIAECRRRLGRDPAILDWQSDLNLAGRFPNLAVFSPLTETDVLPYIDRSIDIAVIRAKRRNHKSEAHRVASVVLTVEPDPTDAS